MRQSETLSEITHYKTSTDSFHSMKIKSNSGNCKAENDANPCEQLIKLQILRNINGDFTMKLSNIHCAIVKQQKKSKKQKSRKKQKKQ